MFFPKGTSEQELRLGLTALRGSLGPKLEGWDKLTEAEQKRVARSLEAGTWVSTGRGYALVPHGAPLVPGTPTFSLDDVLAAGRVYQAAGGGPSVTPAAATQGRAGIGGIVGADDPLKAMGEAAARERARLGLPEPETPVPGPKAIKPGGPGQTPGGSVFR